MTGGKSLCRPNTPTGELQPISDDVALLLLVNVSCTVKDFVNSNGGVIGYILLKAFFLTFCPHYVNTSQISCPSTVAVAVS